MSIVFWMVIMQAPIALVPALFVWQWPSPIGWFYLWGVAISGTIAHVLFTRACGLVNPPACNPWNLPSCPLPLFLPGLSLANGLMCGYGWVVRSSLPRGLHHRRRNHRQTVNPAKSWTEGNAALRHFNFQNSGCPQSKMVTAHPGFHLSGNSIGVSRLINVIVCAFTGSR